MTPKPEAMVVPCIWDNILQIYVSDYSQRDVENKYRIEALEQAIKDWTDAIIDWEGIDFVERIEKEKSRALIEAALAREKKE